MDLSKAISETVGRRGIEVVRDRKFVDLLDAAGAFDEEPPVSRHIMTELLDGGFGELIYGLTKKRNDNWSKIVDKTLSDFATMSGYKDELIYSMGTVLLRSTGFEYCAPDMLTHDEDASAKRKKKFGIITVGVGALILFGIWQGFAYTSSWNERRDFAWTMHLANEAYTKGDYTHALSLCQKAENDYNASFRTNSYKKEAREKATEISDRIITKWQNEVQPLLESGNVVKAKIITKELPQNLITEGTGGTMYLMLSEQIDNRLNTKAMETVDALFTDIYLHHGVLSASGKKMLEEHLKVLPDNYWLKFLKKKRNEEQIKKNNQDFASVSDLCYFARVGQRRHQRCRFNRL